MEQIKCSETSAFNNQTPGKYPKDYTQEMEIVYCAVRTVPYYSQSLKEEHNLLLFPSSPTSVVVTWFCLCLSSVDLLKECIKFKYFLYSSLREFGNNKYKRNSDAFLWSKAVFFLRRLFDKRQLPITQFSHNISWIAEVEPWRSVVL